MSAKIEKKRVEELGNYDITKAAEDDVLLIVGTNDGNKSGKIPVSEFRDQMAKFKMANIVTFIVSLIESFVKGKTNNVFDAATAFNGLFDYIKNSWFNPATGSANSENLQALRTCILDGLMQISDDAWGFIKKIYFGDMDAAYYYVGRTTKMNFRHPSIPSGASAEAVPDTIYVALAIKTDGVHNYTIAATPEAAEEKAELYRNDEQFSKVIVDAADWAGGADKQAFIFEWTRQRTHDYIEAMDMEEFMSNINPIKPLISKLTKMGNGINQLSQAVQEMSAVVHVLASANLEARVAALEQALAQAQGGGSTDSPTNGGENQGEPEPDNGEDAALRSRAETLWAQFVGSDASNMTTEEMVAALENGANITPDPNATLAERIEALEALAAQQQ